MNLKQIIPAIGLMLVGCATPRTAWQVKQEAAPPDSFAAARYYERLAQKTRGADASRAWRAAGLSWADPENKQFSYGRALACFQHVNTHSIEPAERQAVRAWVTVLSRLVSAEEAAKEADRLRDALKDADESSEALRGPTPPPTTDGARPRQ